MNKPNSLVKTHFLTKTDQRRAKAFMKARVDTCTQLYENRGGFKDVDILSGALAELAVYRILKEGGVDVSYPDFKIYEKGEKSYDADLTDGLHHFHVKGQTLESKKRYGASWLMQRHDPIINKPPRLHYLVPCTVCTETGRVEIYGIMSILSLVQNACIQECKVPWFRKTKVALYMENIEEIFTKEMLWGFFKSFKERVCQD